MRLSVVRREQVGNAFFDGIIQLAAPAAQIALEDLKFVFTGHGQCQVALAHRAADYVQEVPLQSLTFGRSYGAGTEIRTRV